MHFFNNPEELIICFHVWESGLPLCIIPQVFHFPQLYIWCAYHFSVESNSVILDQLPQIVIKVFRESVAKMLGLYSSGCLEKNVITFSEEVIVLKFTSTSSQLQLSFIQSIQRIKYVIPNLEFPIKVDTCPTTIQQILSMYAHVFSIYHDQTISEAFLGFLMYLSDGVKFDYPKLIVDSMCEQLSNFSTLTSFKYQLFLMYLILDKYATQFQQFLELEHMTPYDIISIFYRAIFLRDPSKGFSQFVNDFASRAYFFIFEVNYPRVPQQFQNYLHPQTKNQIGDQFLYQDYTIIRVYGSEEQPYRIPSFLNPSIFSLEVLRKILH